MEEKKVIIEYDPSDALKQRYALRPTGREGSSVETTIPRSVIEREAERMGMSVESFIASFESMWLYDSFEGMHFTFVPKKRARGKREEGG